MTIERLQQQREYLLLECISGSRAYNLHLPTSDTDLKGIYILPQPELYGMTYTDQVANATNDEVYFEIKRFLELLEKNNPNILELLSTTEGNQLYRHPLMDLIRPEDFLSRLCLDTFAGYAKTQIKKSRGLHKKMNQTFPETRKTVPEFCYVVAGSRSMPLLEWLHENKLAAADCGLSKIDHFRDAYALYHPQQFAGEVPFKGICSGDAANDVQLSTIPAGVEPLTVLYFNKDAYTVYCKDFAAWWEWVALRNDERYRHNQALGAGYDTKHMMHTFRLLTMAEEIAKYREVRVYRHDRDFLLRIRQGAFTYDELLEMAAAKIEQMEQLYAVADLPEHPDPQLAGKLLVSIREKFYGQKK
ncbi:nucleotidyltransferase domain-containing protein [Chitinophaga nivalis]|uniref:Nucleotidyltransferase domain-containing protein n=1 Tax=Chitinophaga nivalis TaxID=2991709 RepID=A0ABT3IKV0_9BACT|nr:nucleotidyltransferase domain-containing protein [Chitinophaga nivalis]MCW3465720.1 nucleotidyltransferase domain-containing protein [Chitinophaga nivalis]MCW3484589.1 nucleotidyltransferase domain-containing protein [Chitinophaga nivalis]